MTQIAPIKGNGHTEVVNATEPRNNRINPMSTAMPPDYAGERFALILHFPMLWPSMRGSRVISAPLT